jgi:catechol-2,3-dioxygenase
MTTVDSGVPRIARLGHVGIYVFDLDAMTNFYSEVLGLSITDTMPGPKGIVGVFLSARPEVEHHELLLMRGRRSTAESRMIQQISFRCDRLEDIKGYHRVLKAAEVEFDMEVSHGNAIGIYFYDPEGNHVEVYWDTGLKARQPFADLVDLDQDVATLLSVVKARVAECGETGYVDPRLASR